MKKGMVIIMKNTKQAIFQLGDESYGLDIMEVNTIEKFITVEQVSNSPKNMKGIIRLRGDIIPVYSLRRKFGLEDKEPDDESRYIITTSNEVLMAYEVDKMQGIVQMEPGQQSEVPSIVKSKDTSYMKSVTNINGHLVILLNHDGLLSEEEQSKIKAIIKK